MLVFVKIDPAKSEATMDEKGQKKEQEELCSPATP